MPATIVPGRLLITGASGKLGLVTLHHLLHTLHVDPQQIIAGTRSVDSEALQSFKSQGVDVRFFDAKDAASVAAAAKDVERALLISNRENDDGASHAQAIRELVRAGVQHIVYTSLQAADVSLAAIAPIHRKTEDFLKQSGVPSYTILRNSMYFENVFPSLSAVSETGGQWLSAASKGKLAGVSRDDTGRAAAYALATDRTESATLDITGPEALVIEEIASNISDVINKPIEVVHLSRDELAVRLVEVLSLPPPVGHIFASLDATTAAGVASKVASDYKALTGVDPVSHREWAKSNQHILANI
ncbi:hypothetical protein Poli38472_010757 [Pythium oligandrum]|uniref:NmrA-like domain-containing protein n=1 Tax=Pythium oligandrum TaxID=41045 RepID=A0A8K1FI45_PYTOL|nr:hypothetical protein Poli38472_010754 [Pythium oligandrum]TMW61694.1 hypothetical protein Poli38472_010757 [Pythium oligandrum]|eukprot:TMW61691.1 hypothetical protein Poli38472_010754 [Pythium oligandrum]